MVRFEYRWRKEARYCYPVFVKVSSLLIVAFLLFAPISVARAAETSSSIPPKANAIFRVVNALRVRKNLPPLRWNKNLREAALKHAFNMHRNNFFDHVSPDGKTVEDRVKATRYVAIDFRTCGCSQWRARFGENLAKGGFTTRTVVLGWIRSAPHRANILSPDFSETGVAVVGEYYVQVFGDIEMR